MIFQVSFFVEPVAATEEENIDDFAIHPAQRWNSISDEAQDVITGDSYEIYSLNNETEGNTEFVKSRGLRTQDMKVSSLLKVDAGGNGTEYARDTLGDAFDFNEDNDQWSGLLAEGNENGLYFGTCAAAAADNFIGAERGIIPTKIFNTFNIRIKSDSAINIFPRGKDTDGSFFTLGSPVALVQFEWNEISFNLDDDSDWTDDQEFVNTYFQITDELGNLEGDEKIFVDRVELLGVLDFATAVSGEIEDTWNWETDNDTLDWTGLVNMNVSNGVLNSTIAAGNFDFLAITGLSIDADSFDVMIINIKTSDQTMFLNIRDQPSGTPLYTSSPIGPILLDEPGFNIHTINIGSDSDWTGTITEFSLWFDESDDVLEGDERVEIDYILLLGNWSSEDGFSLGLLNQDQEEAMQFKFTRNDTDNSEHELTISLWDASGTGFSSTTSFQYDQSVDGWLDLSFRLDAIEKQFKFDLDYENGTRIINIDRFSDIFTNLPVNLRIFNTNGNMSLALNNTVGPLARSLVVIDFINAEFSERKWKQVDIPTDPEWESDSWTGSRGAANISTTDRSVWELAVPQLDSASGLLVATVTSPDPALYLATASFEVSGVDKDDGEQHRLLMGSISTLRSGAGRGVLLTILVNGSTVFLAGGNTATSKSARLAFSYLLSDDREILTGQFRFWADVSESNFTDYMTTVAVSDFVDERSTEFVLQAKYALSIETDDTDASVMASLEEFKFVSRDRWQNVDPPKPTPLAPGGNPIVAALQILANIIVAGLRIVIDTLLIPALTVVQNALSAVLNSILGVLTGMAASIGTILIDVGNMAGDLANMAGDLAAYVASFASDIATAVWTGIGDALDFITDAIADIAADIWTAFGTAASDIMDDIVTALISLASDVADLITDVVEFLLPLLTVIATDIADFLFGVLEFLFVLLLTAVAALWNIIADIVFFVWDAFGLPDLIAILTFALTGIVGIIGDAVANLTWFVDVLFTWSNGIFFLGVIMLLAIPVFSSTGGGELMEKMVQANSWDILPIGILGFDVHVPVGLVFWPLLFLVVFLL